MKFFLVLFFGFVGLAFGSGMSGLDMIKSYSVAGAVIGVGFA